MNLFMGVFIVLLTNAELMFTASDLQEEAGASFTDESDWYYLKLVTDALEGDNNTDLYLEDDFTTGNCKGDGELYQQFLDNLCTKLSVPAAVFSVFSLDTLSPGIISVNMSVSAPGSQRNIVHTGLSEMPVFSPEFLVCDHLYTLTMLLHQAEYQEEEQGRQTFTQTPDVIFFTKTLLFLSFLTVSITIIIVALMLSVARSSCDNSHPEDMELLTDDEDFSPRTTSKFNLTLPRKVSSFCLNFRQILEQENYFALNT